MRLYRYCSTSCIASDPRDAVLRLCWVLPAAALLVAFAAAPAAQAQPANDDPDDATEITAVPYSVEADNIEATHDSDDEPSIPSCHTDVRYPRSVWWKYTATAPGTITVNVDGEWDFAPLVAVYDEIHSSATDVACDKVDDGGVASASIEAEPGQTYYIFVSGRYSSGTLYTESGEFDLELSHDYPPVPASGPIYVDAGATDGVDQGFSWEHAFTDLQDALDIATPDNEVWIAEGTYTPGTGRGESFTITGAQDSLAIYGGFAGNEQNRGERNPAAHPVVLSGDIDGDGTLSGNSYHVLYLDGTSGGAITGATRLDGVTVTGGNASGSEEDASGGGLLCDGSSSGNACSPTLANVIFTGNRASYYGGAIYNKGRNRGTSSPTITDAAFIDNAVSSRSGGAIYNDASNEGTSSPAIINAVFSENSASQRGGAIYNNGSGPSNGESNPQITNATFSGNSSDGDGGAIYSFIGSSPAIINSILWNNSASGSGDEVYVYASTTLSHTLVAGGCPSGGSCSDLVTSDPLFTDASTPMGADDTFATSDDGLRLYEGSPALDAGDDDAISLSEDLTGADRVQNGTVDLGAYEGAVPAADLALSMSAAPMRATNGDQVTLTLELTNVGSLDATGVAVSAALPAGLSFVNATGDGSYDDQSDVWTVSLLPSGDAATINITATYQASEYVQVSAQVAALDQTDPNAANDEAATTVTSPLPAAYGSGDALTLDGSGDYVDAGDDLRLDGRSFSISFWAKRDGSGSDDYVIGQGSHKSDNQSLHVGFRSRDEFTFAFYGDDLDVSSTYADTDWHHWAVTYDAATGDRVVYRDGMEVASDQAGGDFEGTGTLYVGASASGGPGGHFDGELDEVRIWQTVRTRAQVRQNMNETLSGSESGLLAYYRFDEGSDQVTFDYAGPHLGTLEGDPQHTASGAALGQRSTLANTSGATSLDDLTADVTSGGDDGNYLTLYDYGSKDSSAVTGDAFPQGIKKRADLVWGVEETGDVTADLTFSYAGVSGLSQDKVRLLKRDGPAAAWQDVTDQFAHDAGAQTFAATGVTDFSEFAIGEVGLSLARFAPTAGAPGTEMVITGTEFSGIQGVSIGGTAAAGYTVNSETQITATVPQGATDGPVEVTGAEGTAGSSEDFHVAVPYGGGQALVLDGDHVNAGDDLRLDGRSFSISFWAKRDGSGSDDYVIGQGPNSSDHQSLHVGFRDSDEFAFAFYGDDLDVSSTYTDTGWHHWAVTYDAATGDRVVYRDGMEVASDQAGGDFEGTGTLYIGARAAGGPSGHYDGRLDEVRIWNGVRTQSDIRTSMHQTLAGSKSGLVAYWRFDKGDGSTAYDYAGFHSGTLAGDPAWTSSGVALGQQSTLASTTDPTTLGGAGAHVSISITSTPDADSLLTLYSFGHPDSSTVTGESPRFIGRSHRMWGIEETGAVTADLTVGYSAVAGVAGVDSAKVRLLKRDGPTAGWQDVTDQFTHDAEAQTFSAAGLSSFSEFAVAEAPLPRTIYVDADASGAGDGSTWTDAFTSLQDGLTAARNRDTLWVAEGTYTPGSDRDDSFTITGVQDGLEIYGGFGGDETTLSERDPAQHVTVLSGDVDGDGTLSGNSYHVLYLDGTTGGPITASTVIDGVTVTGGNANGDRNAGNAHGAGLYCNGTGSGNACSPTLANVTFTGNSVDYYGGGAYNRGDEGGASSPTFTDVVFTDNSAFIGGALFNDGYKGGASSPTLTDVVFTNNTSGNGGALFNDGRSDGASSPTITRAVFTGNSASGRGGAIANYGFGGGSHPVITGVTFAGNGADRHGGAIYNSDDANPDITNAILYGNSADTDGDGDGSGDEIYNEDDAAPTLRHTLIAGGCPARSDCGDGSTIISGNPLFTNAADPDGADNTFATADDGLRLADGSPALDVGDNAAAGSKDLTGAERVQNGTVDLGPYEGEVPTVDLALSMDADTTTAASGDAVTFTLELANDGSLDATGIEVNAALPDDFSYVSDTGGDSYDDQSGTWTVGTLGTDAAATIDITATYQASDPVSFAAEVSAVDQADPDGANDDAEVTVLPPLPAAYGSGQALVLDGSGDYVNAGDGIRLDGRSFSISFWVKRASTSGSDYIIGQGSEKSSNQALHIGFRDHDTFTFAFYSNDLNTPALNLDTGWHHWAVTYDAATGDRSIYRDGIELASDQASGDFEGTGTFYIGRQGYSSSGIAGQVDEVRVWQGVRTQQEVRQSMHRTLAGSEAALQAYWRFDKGDGSTAYDYANKRLGTLAGDAAWTSSGAALGQQSALANTTGETILGSAGASVRATPDSAGTGTYLTLYAYGSQDSSAVTGETFPAGISKRAHLVWGVEETGSPTTSLSFSYGGVSDLNLANVRLLKREGPGAPWQDVSDQFTWNENAQTFTATGVSSFSQFTIGEADQPLPVELASFEATADGESIRLAWQTASETNNARFDIQRKTTVEASPQAKWQTVGEREGAGTITKAQSYRFTDQDVPFAADTVRYRLRQIDRDGTAALSEVRAVAVGAPDQFALHGSFPNPFRQAATIRYELPEAVEVRIDIYDVLGRRVRTLADERQEAGRKQMRFEAAELPSGVYFYRITAGDYSETRRMVRAR